MISPIGLKIEVGLNEPLSKHTSWRIGGNALFMAWPKQTDEIIELLDFIREEGLPFYVIGKGSNVLFPDAGFPGVVINLLKFEKDYLKIVDTIVETSSGMPNNILVQRLAEHDLGGLEFLSSIPGSVGGACVQNAGFSRCRGVRNEIGNFVESVQVLSPDGEVRVMNKSDLVFNYRDTNLRLFIVLKARLRFEAKPKKEVQEEIHANYLYRSQVQDLQHPSAGSVFKNPQAGGLSSGQMIDRVGLRGARIGDAQISERHANFFINLGKATAEDMRSLIHLAKEKVEKEFGVKLEEEIRYVGIE